MSVSCSGLFKVHRSREGDAAALQGLSLEVDAGEMLAVLGPSGSGKSTLLRILAGLEAASAGSAMVYGHDMARLSARRRHAVRRRHIGLVGQHADRALSPTLTIRESILVPLTLRGATPARAGAAVEALTERVGLARDVLGARPRDLSGGERQRAAVCVALAHRPPVLLADEPTGELDAAAAEEVLGLLRGLADEQGTTVVLVTHDPAGAAAAHRVVRIRDGRVSAEEHDDQRTVVIGQGGWLHVPEAMLEQAGFGDRGLLRTEGREIILAPAGPSAGPSAEQEPGSAKPPAGHDPLRVARRDGASAELRAVDKRYGSRTVFESFDADLPAGRFIAVTGRSGSGKSTLLRLVAGLERADAGAVRVAGEPLDGRSREALAELRRRHVAYVPQELQLAPFLTAVEHVALPSRVVGATSAEARSEAERWLRVLGLDHRVDQKVGRLSGGELQRVAIARAMTTGRGLLLVDEPTSRLDEANAALVAGLLRRMSEEHGMTVVCATHDPVVAAEANTTIALA